MIRYHTSLAILTAALFAAPLFAAPVPKSDGPEVEKLLARVRVDNLGGMLAQPTLEKAFGLTADQRKKIDALTDEVTGKVQVRFMAAKQGGNAGAGVETMLDVFGMIAEMNGELDAEATKALTADQLRRARQIQLQKEGPAGLLGRHALRALQPTVEQEDRMAAELAKLRKVPMIDEIIAASSGGLGGPGNEELPAFKKMLEKFCTDTDAVYESMLKVLTKEQRAKWEAMVGEPLPRFELLVAGSPLGDGKLVKAIDAGQNAQQPQPPVVAQPVIPAAGGAPPPGLLPPPAAPPPLPVGKK